MDQQRGEERRGEERRGRKVQEQENVDASRIAVAFQELRDVVVLTFVDLLERRREKEGEEMQENDASRDVDV